ncbi:dUTP diphosphatase [Paenibacillus bouchesdurhonensis]|uniref:dUTP diphosphatase n=1 Tax=Paenibacillus bouchesdurhonensis TaxID=1870990 RepID=UPI000DA62118|nr:dUTP diphosphatase [Paenibacillus bouchesdurhonensis]
MDIVKLYNMQRELDERIIKQHGLEGQDLLPQKILALQVELGECANEWRGFKYWSKDQQPRYIKNSIAFANPGGPFEYTTYPLLEEYIDCLHFILSIGIEIGIDIYEFGFVAVVDATTTDTFLSVFEKISEFSYTPDSWNYEGMFNSFAGLGKMLGFTWEQIEEAYMSKNSENHRRQDNGY